MQRPPFVVATDTPRQAGIKSGWLDTSQSYHVRGVGHADDSCSHLRQRCEVADGPDSVEERRLCLPAGGEHGDQGRECKCGLQCLLQRKHRLSAARRLALRSGVRSGAVRRDRKRMERAPCVIPVVCDIDCCACDDVLRAPSTPEGFAQQRPLLLPSLQPAARS